MRLYEKKYEVGGDTVKVNGFELPIQLPVRPDRSEMLNYGLPPSEQKFVRTAVPFDLKNMDITKRRLFIEGEWHKRLHGVWMLINDKEVYIPGTAYFFFNYWWCAVGRLPDFRMEAVDFFLVWEHCLADPNCFGMAVIKCRRVGDTEKVLCAGYELCTRFRNSWFGMQNVTDTFAQDNFNRTVRAFQKMAYFFVPSFRGNTQPKAELEFSPPPEAVTAKRKREGFVQTNTGIGSKIDFRPTTTPQYDGNALRMYHLDEFAKVDPTKMDVEAQWNIVRPTMTVNNETVIVGKAVFTSTVENLKGGATVKLARTIWKGSNPHEKDENKRTSTGLYRYFRSYLYAAAVDEFGFPKTEEARAFRANRIAFYESRKELVSLSGFLRKQPANIEEALSLAASDSVLLPELLDLQLRTIQQVSEDATHRLKAKLPVRGDLVWTNGLGSDVKWVPHQNGKFWVSQPPVTPNSRYLQGGRHIPNNIGNYAIGIDPIDHTKPTEGGSDGGIAVFRPYNVLYETEIEFDGGEIANPEVMQTDKFVCTYRYRPTDPNEFYEDALKCAIWYGVPIFPETDKPGILGYFERNGFYSYLLFKPRTVELPQGNNNTPGSASRTPLINAYVGRLTSHVARRSATYFHENQLWDFRNFDGENRGECDLMVASGYALLAADFMNAVSLRQQAKQGWDAVKLNKYAVR